MNKIQIYQYHLSKSKIYLLWAIRPGFFGGWEGDSSQEIFHERGMREQGLWIRDAMTGLPL